jgi:Tol biopolymer transport system component
MVEVLKRRPVREEAAREQLALFLIGAAGGDVTLVSDGLNRELSYCGSPSWSRDGRRIFFDASPGQDWRKTRLEAIDGAGPRARLTDLGPGNCPTPSPDGPEVAFLLASLALSPDGRYVLFCCDRFWKKDG